MTKPINVLLQTTIELRSSDEQGDLRALRRECSAEPSLRGRRFGPGLVRRLVRP
jgi:hypothetical protein